MCEKGYRRERVGRAYAWTSFGGAIARGSCNAARLPRPCCVCSTCTSWRQALLYSCLSNLSKSRQNAILCNTLPYRKIELKPTKFCKTIAKTYTATLLKNLTNLANNQKQPNTKIAYKLDQFIQNQH